MVKKILLEGKKIGFSATEVFRKKIEKTEFKNSKDQNSIQTIKTDRLIVRAFRELGDPVGFTISTPDIKQVRAAFHTLYSAFIPDSKISFAEHLPREIKKVDMNIWDDKSFEYINEASFRDLREKIFETQTASFPGLKIESINFSKMLKKVYLTNTKMFETENPKAKYRKTSFNLEIQFSYNNSLIEIIENKPSFLQINPERIVSRAYNLLNSLTENKRISTNIRHFILSPEASSSILREFSEYFKLTSEKKMKNLSFPQALSIVDNPLLDEESNSVPFDDEGVQSSENFIIQKGFIKDTISDIRSGFENNKDSTGNGFRTQRSIFPAIKFTNLFIKPSTFPFSKLHSDAGSGILISLIKLRRVQNGIYTFSAYGYEFNNEDIDNQKPIHIYIKTTIESFFLNILKVSKEIRFFYNRINVGSPYVLLEPGKKSGNMFEF